MKKRMMVTLSLSVALLLGLTAAQVAPVETTTVAPATAAPTEGTLSAAIQSIVRVDVPA